MSEPTRPAGLGSDVAAQLLADDPAWRYLGLHGTTSVRRLRVWRAVDGGLVAVVTEGPDDDGTSVANAAEHIVAKLQAEWGPDVEVIEHQLPRTRPEDDDQQWTWTLTGLPVGGNTVPDGVEYLELPPPPPVIPGSLERVLLDAHGQATWRPITPAGLARRFSGGQWLDPEPR